MIDMRRFDNTMMNSDDIYRALGGCSSASDDALRAFQIFSDMGRALREMGNGASPTDDAMNALMRTARINEPARKPTNPIFTPETARAIDQEVEASATPVRKKHTMGGLPAR